jgi:hypothetical protein
VVALHVRWARRTRAVSEVALIGMTLQHVADPAAALRDIGRVLGSGGALIAVEPDQTGSQTYFDGVLHGVNDAFRELLEAVRRHRRPADMAIGPAVARLVEREGLRVEEFFPYAVGKSRKTAAKEFFSGLAQGVGVVAALLPAGAPELERCRAALAAAEAGVGSSTEGWGCQFVPVFVCVARKG